MNDNKSRYQKTDLSEAFISNISKLLFDADLININFVDNTDEYDIEAEAILPLLLGVTSAKEVNEIVYKILCKHFGKDMTPKNHHSRMFRKQYGILLKTKNR